MKSSGKDNTKDSALSNSAAFTNEKALRVKKKTLLGVLRSDAQFWLLCLPAIALLFVFAYIPMYGVGLSFLDYSIRGGLFGSEFVGLKWFMRFFDSEFFFRILKNTLLLNILNILFTFPVPIAFALMLNEVQNKYFKKTVQTISYMPHFISTVIVVGIMVNMFSPTSGVVNKVLVNLGFTEKGINFFLSPEWFRPLYIGSELWQHFGWNSIIYLASLSSIDAQLYEAAQMDGAGKWSRLWHVTLPGITPIIIIQLVLSLGSMMNVGFEKILLMYDPATYETSDVIATYTYREGIISGNYGYGAAVGLFNSVINLFLLVIFNKVAKSVSEVSLW